MYHDGKRKETGHKPKKPGQETDGNRTGKEAENGAGNRGSERGAKGVKKVEVTA